MTKKAKIILLIISIFVAIIFTSYTGLMYYWHTASEPKCNRAGGQWTGVHGCDNYCNNDGKYCPDKLIFGCSCGLDKCWDGKKCVEQ